MSIGDNPPETFVVVFNPSAGAGHEDGTPDRISGFLEARGQRVILRRLDREGDIAGLCAAAAREADRNGATLVACGGDGTLNAVASAALEVNVPLGLLPQGTFNYFGRAHGIPSDLDESLAILLAGQVRPAQVATVNGRLFLVNASIGMYPELLEDREAWKRRLGRHRLVAIGSALATIVRSYRLWRIEVDDGSEVTRMLTPTLLVGNNPLQFAQLGIAESAKTGRGELVAVSLRPVGRWALFLLGLRGALGQLGEADDIETHTFRRMTVTFRRDRSNASVKVALDGEIVLLQAPLRFEVSSRSLRLRAPHPASAEDDPG